MATVSKVSTYVLLRPRQLAVNGAQERLGVGRPSGGRGGRPNGGRGGRPNGGRGGRPIGGGSHFVLVRESHTAAIPAHKDFNNCCLGECSTS